MGEIGSLVEVSATDKVSGSLTMVYGTTQNLSRMRKWCHIFSFLVAWV